MGRPKSKKPRTQPANSNATSAHTTTPTLELVVADQVSGASTCTENEVCVDSISDLERSLETATALMVSMEENELGTCVAEPVQESSPAAEDVSQSVQMSAILNKVEKWIEETEGPKDPLDQKLSSEVVINYDKLDVVLPHYRTQQPKRNVESGAGAADQVSQSEEMLFSIARLEESFEQMTRQLEQRVENFLCGLEARIDQQIRQLAMVDNNHSNQLPETRSESPSVSAPRVENKSQVESAFPESDWERRKRELLVDFGLSRDEIEQIVPKNSSHANHSAPKESEAVQVSENVQTVAEADESAVCFTSFEIDQLKEQLTAKLREAELELSINRAKLLQESTALEQRSADVSRREAALKSKYAEIEGTNKTGLLDRLTRHLSRKTK